MMLRDSTTARRSVVHPRPSASLNHGQTGLRWLGRRLSNTPRERPTVAVQLAVDSALSRPVLMLPVRAEKQL